jgi:hypothetical protein
MNVSVIAITHTGSGCPIETAAAMPDGDIYRCSCGLYYRASRDAHGVKTVEFDRSATDDSVADEVRAAVTAGAVGLHRLIGDR